MAMISTVHLLVLRSQLGHMASRHQPVGGSAPQRALFGYNVEHTGADTPACLGARTTRFAPTPILPLWPSASGFESLLIRTIRFARAAMSSPAQRGGESDLLSGIRVDFKEISRNLRKIRIRGVIVSPVM